MTFEQLIRQHVMAQINQALPGIPLDAKGEPNTARVLIAARDFSYDDLRKYKLGVSGNPLTLQIAKVIGDMTVTAAIELHSKDQMDIEPLLAILLAADSVVWTWRGYEIRVGQSLANTRLADIGPALRETIQVRFEAPYIDVTSLPVISDGSFFDGWNYTMEVGT